MARNFGVASLLSASIGLCAVLLCGEPSAPKAETVRAPVARAADARPHTLADASNPRRASEAPNDAP